jgi:hypothetical protein
MSSLSDMFFSFISILTNGRNSSLTYFEASINGYPESDPKYSQFSGSRLSIEMQSWTQVRYVNIITQDRKCLKVCASWF